MTFLERLRSGVYAGVPFMLLAMIVFAGNDALAKHLSGLFAVAQILAIRSAAGLIMVAPRLHRYGWYRTFVVPRLGLHVLRLLLIVAEVALFYAAVRYMPLAQCLTIYQAMPVFATALAMFVLGERVRWRRWTAIIAGFIGVILVLDPSTEGIGWPALMAFAGTVLYAGVNVLTRLLRDAGPETLIGWHAAGTFVITGAVAPFVWVPIGVADFALAVVLGLTATFGHMLLNRALSLSPTSVVMPFHYTMIVWALILGWMFWNEVPDLQMLTGATIIVASGLYILYREHRLAQHQG
jgi:drug/metabolite transporter (DMT)-like permease